MTSSYPRQFRLRLYGVIYLRNLYRCNDNNKKDKLEGRREIMTIGVIAS